MSVHTLKYKLDDEGIKIVAGCAAKQIVQEIHDAVAVAFREINVTLEVDDDWGICRIIACNGEWLEGKYEERLTRCDK